MIIHIHKDTRQKSLFDELAKVAGKDGYLVVVVKSLPIYLSTKIAFSILSYRLRNYPRRILWTSDDKKILELLSLSEVEVDYKFFDVKPKLVFGESESKKEINLKKNIESVTTAVELVDSNEVYESTDNFLHQFANVEISVDDLKDSSDLIEISKIEIDKDEIESQEDLPKFAHTGGFDSKLEQINSFQNLDSWLERIEATKMALNYMKREDVDRIFGVKEFFDKKKFSANSTINRINSKKSKSFRFLSAFFACAIFLILLFSVFSN